jgi:hypothetical protein
MSAAEALLEETAPVRFAEPPEAPAEAPTETPGGAPAIDA